MWWYHEIILACTYIIINLTFFKTLNWCKKISKAAQMFFQYRNFSRVQHFGEKKNPTFIVCPKPSGIIKIPKLPKKIQASWRNFPKGITQSDQYFRQHEKNKPMFPQVAQTFCMIWKAHQCQWFNIRVKWIPSHYFIYLLYVKISALINNEDSECW